MQASDSFKLSPVTVADDHRWLVELHNDPLVLRNITHPTPITLETHLRWWNGLNTEKEKRFLFTENGNRIGFTKFYSIDRINSNCVLGADIHKDHRGKGYGTIMWKLMLEYAFNTLGLWRVGLTTTEFNSVAIHLYKKMGFVVEGRNRQAILRDGQYHDLICMYLTRDMYGSIL